MITTPVLCIEHINEHISAGTKLGLLLDSSWRTEVSVC